MLLLAISALSAQALSLTGVQSRKTHLLGNASHDLPVDLTQSMSGAVTVESRAIGAGHTIVFQFDGPITSAGVLSVIDDTISPVAGVAAAPAGNDIVVTLGALADNKRVTIALDNVNGIGLNVSASLGFRLGDTNSSGTVSPADVSAVRARAAQTVVGNNFKYDLDTSGVITAADISAAKAHVGAVALPPGNAAPVVSAGANQTVALPAGVTLAGTATDDGLPNPPGALTLLWTRPSGPAPVTFGNASAASTTATFAAPGAYVLRLTANDGQRSGSADVNITVNPGAAASLTVSGLTSPRAAGAAGSVTVAAKDAFGNTATGYTGTIHFTTSDPGAGVILPADYTFTGGDAGVHTFTSAVTMATAGIWAISATDTVSAGIAGSQSNIVVTAGVAATLGRVSPADGSVTSGSTQALIVHVTDGNGNPVAGTTVNWAKTVGNGSISLASSITNGSGQASANATLGTSNGSNAFTATVAGLAGSPITFVLTGTSGAAAKLVRVSPADGSFAAGSSLVLSVRVTDINNNPVTGTTVNWAKTAGNGSISPASSISAVGTGQASSFATLSVIAGSNVFTATGAGLTGSPITFSLTGI